MFSKESPIYSKVMTRRNFHRSLHPIKITTYIWKVRILSNAFTFIFIGERRLIGIENIPKSKAKFNACTNKCLFTEDEWKDQSVYLWVLEIPRILNQIGGRNRGIWRFKYIYICTCSRFFTQDILTFISMDLSWKKKLENYLRIQCGR